MINIQKGFTLIELIIVIAVIAILATTVILVINPASILAEARDSQRIADLGQMNSALSLYLATVSGPDLDGALDGLDSCWVHTGSPAKTTQAEGSGDGCGGRHTATKEQQAGATRVVDSTGWIPVNLTSISGGSPLTNWPVDPTNNATYFYSYAGQGSATTTYSYEIDANMESTRYGLGGSDDVETGDGGSSTSLYEIGTNVNI